MSERKATIAMSDIDKLALEISAANGPGSAGWNETNTHTKHVNDAVMQGLRENNGKLSGELEGVPFLILTTIGARSGRKRTIPLACMEIDDRLIIIASMGGASRNPPWYHNLVKHPEVTVEKDGETFSARAVVTDGTDRDKLFQIVCDAIPVFASYQARTGGRVIPVVELIRQ